MAMNAKKVPTLKSALLLSFALALLAGVLLMPKALAELPPAGDALMSERKHQIEAALRNGDLAPLQAEFMLLASRNFDSPRDRFMAMREWQVKNGEAMKAELNARRAHEEPQRQARIAAARQERAAQIAEGLASGHLGPLEADLASLMNREYANPNDRMQALRAWRAANHQALEAERRARHGDEAADREERMAAIQAHRNQSIADAAASGRIGPLEAEFLTLRGQSNTNLKEKHEAIRTWLARNGEALENERAARASVCR